MAHTPGPWRVGYWSGRCTKPSHEGGKHVGLRGDDPCVYDPIFMSDFNGIAADNGHMVVTTRYDELVIGDDDALLIAAAPDLLAACQLALAAMQQQDRADIDAMDALEAAIAKAIA